jgi:hypothetical protein
MPQCTQPSTTFKKKEEFQMAKKDMKKCSTSLAIKELQIKTMLRFHFVPVRMATIKNIKYW